MKKIMQTLMFSALVVPTNTESEWQKLQFKSIPSHEVKFTENGMKLKVSKSAMPIIYPLKSKKLVRSVRFKIKFDQLIQLPKDKTQGEKGTDDYVFKIGLVFPGEQTLNWFQKKIAAKWVTTLFDLASGGGVDYILFYGVYQQKNLSKSTQTHPLGKGLIKVKNEWFVEKPGEYEFEVKLEKPRRVLALWLSSDGDDTGSSFNVEIQKLEVERLP